MTTVTVKRKRPALDMTPMVDLGFLLVTFFMLTTQFLPQDLVNVTIPHSMSDLKLPESDMLTILVSKAGKVYITTEGSEKFRKSLIEKINEKYALEMGKEELYRFAKMSNFGMPVTGIKQFINLPEEDQKKVQQPGIPCDSLQNELTYWLIFSRISNPKIRLALKADRDTPYPIVKVIFNTLQDCNIDRFSLVTDTEKSLVN